MLELKAKKLVKLGTAVRYLGDVKFKMGAETMPEPFGGGHVLDNMRIVLELTKELGLVGTLDSGAFGKLESLYAEFQKASHSAPALTMVQADELHLLARRVRESLMAESNNKTVYYLSESERQKISSPSWPSGLTVDLVGQLPWGVAKWLVGLVVAAFGFGVGFAETGLYSAVKETVGEWFGSTEGHGGPPPVAPAGELDKT